MLSKGRGWVLNILRQTHPAQLPSCHYTDRDHRLHAPSSVVMSQWRGGKLQRTVASGACGKCSHQGTKFSPVDPAAVRGYIQVIRIEIVVCKFNNQRKAMLYLRLRRFSPGTPVSSLLMLIDSWSQVSTGGCLKLPSEGSPGQESRDLLA